MKHKRKNRVLRFFAWFVAIFLLAVFTFVIWYQIDTKLTPPDITDKSLLDEQRETAGTDFYKLGNNWLRKNEYGLWEMYVEGSPFEMGVASGKLTKELIYKQEEAFVEKIREMVPSESYLKFLKYFIGFFNRDIDEYILPEYQQEIYGISFSASNQFNFIGTNYERMLNYHGAHDIGHALQDLMLVGCTSFAANLGFADSSLIIGRNFDFYINNAFAEDKVVCFVNPDEGHQFAYVTWASFIGVVSGMNNEGLTVTINAGKSDLPSKAATPISLLAREILQYAGNIDEAIAIAEKRKTFVAESLLIGSAFDNKGVIIEKSPTKLGVYQTQNNFIVCSNHFQSEAFADDRENLDHIVESASLGRQRRAEELILQKDTVNYLQAAAILRDRYGLGGQDIGIGNEKAMAQMISHHSVIFEPLRRNMWVSTQPFQLGEYLGYNLRRVFNNPAIISNHGIFDSALTIPADPFLETEIFQNFLLFKEESVVLKNATKNKIELDESFVKDYIALNPNYFSGYALAGDYYRAIGQTEKALNFYKFSLTKEFEKTVQRAEIEVKINQLTDQ
jgi:predicted choloylglycine hydrolase